MKKILTLFASLFAFGALAQPYVPSKASQAEVDAGVNDSKYVTPAKLAGYSGGGVSIATVNNYSNTARLYTDSALLNVPQSNLVSTAVGGNGTGLLLGSGDGDWRANLQVAKEAVVGAGAVVQDGGLVGIAMAGSTNCYVVADSGSIVSGDLQNSTNCWFQTGTGSRSAGVISLSANSYLWSDGGGLAGGWLSECLNSFVYAEVAAVAMSQMNFATNSHTWAEFGAGALTMMDNAKYSSLTANAGTFGVGNFQESSNVIVTLDAGSITALQSSNAVNQSMSLFRSLVVGQPPNNYTNTFESTIAVLGKNGELVGFNTNGHFGNGSGLTNLQASNLTGTMPDALLYGSNVWFVPDAAWNSRPAGDSFMYWSEADARPNFKTNLLSSALLGLIRPDQITSTNSVPPGGLMIAYGPNSGNLTNRFTSMIRYEPGNTNLYIGPGNNITFNAGNAGTWAIQSSNKNPNLMSLTNTGSAGSCFIVYADNSATYLGVGSAANFFLDTSDVNHNFLFRGGNTTFMQFVGNDFSLQPGVDAKYGLGKESMYWGQNYLSNIVAKTISSAAYVTPTNSATTAPDFTKSAQLYVTNNNSLVLTAPTGIDATKYQETLYVVIGGGTGTAITTTGLGTTRLYGTWYVTNETQIKFQAWGNRFTNAIATPMF